MNQKEYGEKIAYRTEPINSKYASPDNQDFPGNPVGESVKFAHGISLFTPSLPLFKKEIKTHV